MNPLLRVPFEIPFHEIRVEHIVPAVRELLAESQQNCRNLQSNAGGG